MQVMAMARMTPEEFAAAGLVVGVDAEGTSTCYDDGRMDVMLYTAEGMRKANLVNQVRLIADDRVTAYPVTYFGVATFPCWPREDGGTVGQVPVALVREEGQGREYLIAQHPDCGWCAVGVGACDFDPPLDQDRLEKAS